MEGQEYIYVNGDSPYKGNILLDPDGTVTRAELTEVVRDERRRDDLWPYDANLWDVAVDGECSAVYLLDNCMHWHPMEETDDMAVVWDD